MHYIDSHFHSLSMSDKGVSAEDSVSFICAGIDVGTNYNDLPQRSAFIDKFEHIKKSAAMGPWETRNSTEKELNERFEQLKKNIEQYKPDFIGEFGLDYHNGYGTPDCQAYLMKLHLDLAKQLKKKVIIHTRDAEEDTVKILKQYPDVFGIIHCFSGSTELLKTALDLGYYISYAGNVTYKANSALTETLESVPVNRLLLETDAPYLAPVPKRGIANSSCFIEYTYKFVADFLQKDSEQLIEEIYSNFKELCSTCS